MMNLNKILLRFLFLVCTLLFVVVGCATNPNNRYILIPKDIYINGNQHKCYHSISVFNTKPNSMPYYGNDIQGPTIAYLCQGKDIPELVMVEQDYEYSKALIDAYHSFKDSGTVSIAIGGKTWNGTIWDGMAILKKDDPKYPAAFGSSFRENLPENLLRNNCCLINDIYVWKRVEN